MPITPFSVPYIWYSVYALFSYFFFFYISLSPNRLKLFLNTCLSLSHRTWHITAAQETWLWIINLATNMTSCIFRSNSLSGQHSISLFFFIVNILEGFSYTYFFYFFIDHPLFNLLVSLFPTTLINLSNVTSCAAKCNELFSSCTINILSPLIFWPKLVSLIAWDHHESSYSNKNQGIFDSFLSFTPLIKSVTMSYWFYFSNMVYIYPVMLSTY